MNHHEIPRLLRYLKANGAWVELDDDAEDAWAHALRNFDGQAVKAGARWFLERNHPREIAPATIAAAVRSLLASGRIREPACPDHPQEIARACRCCAGDVLAGDRPRGLVGRAHPALTGARERTAGIAPPRSRAADPVTGPADLRAMDPERWDRLQAQGAAQRAQDLAGEPCPAQAPPRRPGERTAPREAA